MTGTTSEDTRDMLTDAPSLLKGHRMKNSKAVGLIESGARSADGHSLVRLTQTHGVIKASANTRLQLRS